MTVLDPPLNWRERMFLRWFCVPPPPEPYEPRDEYNLSAPPPVDPNPLALLRSVFGDRLERAARNRSVIDIGCGLGSQILGLAQSGSALAVGIDKTEINVRIANLHAATLGLSKAVRFTTDPIESLGQNWADVAISQNAFEHFDEPGEILRQAYDALKPGGQFFVTFGPPWLNPYGVHHFFMIKRPWVHCLFSERTILRVRRLYRPNKPTRWRDVALNQMTIAKFVALVGQTRFDVSELSLRPIRPLPSWVASIPVAREYATSNVAAVLTKPGGVVGA
jgi:SAM-dependent methyltransferase